MFTPRELSSRISEAKNHSLDALEFFRDSYANKEIVRAYVAYQKQLKQCNALDFDDLLLLTLQLFVRFPDVLEKYRRKFRYILVDEYQDTNLVQYPIVQMLASEHRIICVFGDDDQRSTGCRRGDIRNILELKRTFPGSGHLAWAEYRCRGNPQRCIRRDFNNARVKRRKLWTEKQAGESHRRIRSDGRAGRGEPLLQPILEGARYGERRYDDYSILPTTRRAA
jgi:DNA helicase-2/ATP-dependent DNA helicase PcrA